MNDYGAEQDQKPPQLFFETYPQPTNLEYHGTLQATLAELQAGENLLIGPTRLARAILDSPLDGDRRLHLLEGVTAFMQDTYRSGPQDVTALGQELLDALGDCAIDQQEDFASIIASEPERSLEGARQIAALTDKPILMLPLCHGGLQAGVQALEIYRQLSPQNADDSHLYPIRFSRVKQGHTGIPITPEEVSFLRQRAKGRTVIVYDEDSSTGDSVLMAMQDLAQQLDTSEIFGVVNVDMRNAREQGYVEQQGLHWEHYAELPPPVGSGRETEGLGLAHQSWFS